MSATERYSQSKLVLSGGLHYEPGYRGVDEDDSFRLIREGVTGGNLRAHSGVINQSLINFYQTDGRGGEGIYQQFVQDKELVSAIVDHFASRGIAASPEEIVVGSGATQIFAACCAYLGAQHSDYKGVIVTETPFYHSFALTPPYYGLTLESLETFKGNLHKLTAREIRKAYDDLKQRSQTLAAVLLFCPTLLGENYSQTELDIIFQETFQNCKDENSRALFIEDTVYHGIELQTTEDTNRSASVTNSRCLLQDGTARDGRDYTVTIGSLSKSFCAPNIRVGFARAPEKIARFLRQFIVAHQVEVPRDHQVAAAVALRETPKSFFVENNVEYARRVDVVKAHLEDLNKELRSFLSEQVKHSEKLRTAFLHQGVLNNIGEFDAYFNIVSLYHYPSAANILYLDFRNCAGLKTEELEAEVVKSPFLTKLNLPLLNSLSITREFMDGAEIANLKGGIALSPGWALGFHRRGERYVCKMQIAQFGQRMANETGDWETIRAEVDSIFNDFFYRMRVCLEEFFKRQ